MIWYLDNVFASVYFATIVYKCAKGYPLSRWFF